MRRSREDACETRRSIVGAAARIFRERGIAAVSIADIMGSLGLTVGGFYRHFSSKDALVAEAIETASQETVQGHQERIMGVERAHRASRLLDVYLSEFHRAHPGEGCPVAALCGEMRHESRSTRAAFTAALRRVMGMVEGALPPSAEKRRQRVLRDSAAIVGALALARATDDEALARDLLDAVRTDILRRPSLPRTSTRLPTAPHRQG